MNFNNFIEAFSAKILQDRDYIPPRDVKGSKDEKGDGEIYRIKNV